MKKLLIDAKEYTSNIRLIGYVIIIFLEIIILPIFFFISLTGGDCITVFLINLFVLLLAIFLFKSIGMFAVPLKVYDKGIELISKFSFKHSFIPFKEIHSIGFLMYWDPGFVKRVCYIKTKLSYIESHQPFPNKEKLKEFIEELKPIISKHGFKLKSQKENKRHIEILFEK